jgi:hypothetical protein
MTDKLEISDKAIQAISSAAERLIGYIYAGLFPAVIIIIEKGNIVENLVRSVGGIFTALICITVGIGIFSFYNKIVGELVVFSLQHFLHFAMDKLTLKSAERGTSDIRFLIRLGVPWTRAREAYMFLRDNLADRRYKVTLELEHGEIHVLYLTACICLGTYILLDRIRTQPPTEWYLYIAAAAYLAATLADIRQHARECAWLRNRKNEVIGLLRENGYTVDQ